MDYITTGEQLTAIADAIRTVSNTSGQLTFPDGFTSGIARLNQIEKYGYICSFAPSQAITIQYGMTAVVYASRSISQGIVMDAEGETVTYQGYTSANIPEGIGVTVMQTPIIEDGLIKFKIALRNNSSSHAAIVVPINAMVVVQFYAYRFAQEVTE